MPNQPRYTHADTTSNSTGSSSTTNGTGMATTPTALTSTALSSAGEEITLTDLLNDTDTNTSTGTTPQPDTDTDTEMWDPWDLDTTSWTALDYTIHTTLTGTQPALTPLQLATAAHTGFTHLQYLTTITNPTHLTTLTHHWNDGVPTTITRLAQLDTPTGADHHHLLHLTGHATTNDENAVDEDVVRDAMATLDDDLEWLTLGQPELVAAAAGRDDTLASLTDHPRAELTVIRQEAVAGTSYVEIHYTPIAGEPIRDDYALHVTTQTSTGEETPYLFLLIHDPATGTYHCEADLPSPTQWITLRIALPPRGVTDPSKPIDPATITRSVHTATNPIKTAWQALARTQRDLGEEAQPGLVTAVINGLT